jgi:hypothetical protein
MESRGKKKFADVPAGSLEGILDKPTSKKVATKPPVYTQPKKKATAKRRDANQSQIFLH